MSDFTPTNDSRQLLAWAEYYNSHGLTVVPVKKDSKQPAMGNGWQDNVDNVTNIAYLHKDSNLGILLGEKSANYVDIDLDCEEARILAPRFLPHTSRFGRATSQFSHYVYRVTCSHHEGEKVIEYHKKLSYGDMGTIAEYRSNGQTVHPPSIHAGTGEYITWYDQNPMENITVIEASELHRDYLKLAAMVILQQHVVPGIKHHATVHIVGVLWHLGWDIEETDRFIDVLIDACSMDGADDRRKCIYDTYQKGDNDLSNIGGFNELVNVFDQSLQDGPRIIRALRTILMQTSKGKGRTLTPSEVFQRCPNIKTSMDKYMLTESPAPQQLQPLEAIEPLSSMQPLLPEQPAMPQQPILSNGVEGTINLGELEPIVAENMEISIHDEVSRTDNSTYNYLVENLLPQGELGFVFGDSGTYKTFLVLDMLMSMCHKEEWASKRMAPNMGDTLMITGEGRNTLSDRVRIWMQENGLNSMSPRYNQMYIYDHPIDLFADPRRDYTERTSIDELEEYLKQRSNIKLIVMDTWSSLFSGDENSSKDVAPTLKRLKDLCERFSVTVLIVHHKGKNGGSYRGSGALTANSDFNFDISREMELGQDDKSEDNKPTGRIIFEDKQQRSSASNTKLFFKPETKIVQGRTTNFGEQLKNVIMTHDTGKPIKRMDKKFSRTGIAAFRKSYADTQIDGLRRLIEVFKLAKRDGGSARGLDMPEMHSRFKQISNEAGLISKDYNAKNSFERYISRLVEVQLMSTQHGSGSSDKATVYYGLTALAHEDIRRLDADLFNQNLYK